MQKTNCKNLGQNPDNLKHFLMIDFNYNCEKAMKLIGEVIVANIMKSITFIGKVAFRIIRADSNADDTIIVPERLQDNSHIVQNNAIEDRNCCTETAVIEDSQTALDDQQISNILNIIENFRTSLEAVEKSFSNPISGTNQNTRQDNFYRHLLKNRISELEKLLADKNAIIDFLSAQIKKKL